MLHGLLLRAFMQMQHALQPDNMVAASSPSSSSPSTSSFLTLTTDTIASADGTTSFSYHAFLGSDTCHPAPWERTWGVALAVLLVLYLCIVLTRVCDRSLIPALEILARKWGLADDVAGVTLLAFGGSLPELAIHTIATLEGSEIGVGTVIGSAVFNVTIGLAVIAFLTPYAVPLRVTPLVRDTLAYGACLSILLVCFHWRARVTVWQATGMIVLYLAYVAWLVLKNQSRAGPGVFSPEPKSPVSVVKGGESRDEGQASEHASQHEGHAADQDSEPEHGEEDRNHPSSIAKAEKEGLIRKPRPTIVVAPNTATTATASDGSTLSSPSSSSSSSSSSSPYRLLRRIYHFINRPTDYLTPDCTTITIDVVGRWFVLSLIIVLILSFTIMCLVQYMGCVSSIDHAVSGLLFLGVAASLPDIISVGVSARRGLGIMAVSGLIGSNVFDILIGLGTPWLLYMSIHNQTYVPLTSDKIYLSSIIAIIAVGIFGLSLILNRMQLKRDVAWLPIVMYAVYVVCVLKKVADPPEDAPVGREL